MIQSYNNIVLRRYLAFVSALGLCAGCTHRNDSSRALEILRQNRDAMFALRTYRAQCITEQVSTSGKGKSHFEFAAITSEKPQSIRYDCWRSRTPFKAADLLPKATPNLTFAGVDRFQDQQFGNRYRIRGDATPQNTFTVEEPWGGFYDRSNSILGSYERVGSGEAKYVGIEKIEGTLCDTVEFKTKTVFAGVTHEGERTYWFGVIDHLARRAVETVSFDGQPGFRRDAVIKNIRLNEQIDPSVYSYSPPKGVVLETPTQNPYLLPIGSKAPDFTSVDTGGTTLKLSDLRGKVVVLDFWASWCGPCKQSMPHTEDVARSLAASGMSLVVLAVDDGEAKPSFDAWVSANKATYSNIRFAYSDPSHKISYQKFLVTGIPSQYVIDRKGVIRASFVGYSGPNDTLKNAIVAANKM